MEEEWYQKQSRMSRREERYWKEKRYKSKQDCFLKKRETFVNVMDSLLFIYHKKASLLASKLYASNHRIGVLKEESFLHFYFDGRHYMFQIWRHFIAFKFLPLQIWHGQLAGR